MYRTTITVIDTGNDGDDYMEIIDVTTNSNAEPLNALAAASAAAVAALTGGELVLRMGKEPADGS